MSCCAIDGLADPSQLTSTRPINALWQPVSGARPDHTNIQQRAPDNLFLKVGAAEGIRTPDPIITNDVLYQLSYSGTINRLIASQSNRL